MAPLRWQPWLGGGIKIQKFCRRDMCMPPKCEGKLMSDCDRSAGPQLEVDS